MSEYEVYVKRQPTGGDGALIPLDAITSIGWGEITGGIRMQTPVAYLMGLISEETMRSANIKCSGMHNYDNGIKVCIIKGHTPTKTWKYLMELYGPSPSLGERKRKPYCTTRIIQLLERENKHELCRKALRDILREEGYKASRIRNAIKSVSLDGRVETKGSSFSPNQIIRLPKNENVEA